MVTKRQLERALRDVLTANQSVQHAARQARAAKRKFDALAASALADTDTAGLASDLAAAIDTARAEFPNLERSDP